jgi:8-oxo-dGTP diphosphatase
MQKPRMATLALVERGEMLLLGEKLTGEIGVGKYNGPGGKAEPGESPRQCLIRELWEECRIRTHPEALRHAGRLDCYVREPAPGLFLSVEVYWIRSFWGQPRTTDSMRPAWFSRGDLPYATMHEADRYWLPRFLQGDRRVASLQYLRAGECFWSISFAPYEPETP